MDSYAGVAYENRPSVEDQGNTVLNTFKKIADEIVSGYADGSRVRFKFRTIRKNVFFGWFPAGQRRIFSPSSEKVKSAQISFVSFPVRFVVTRSMFFSCASLRFSFPL